jgi:hypothetical protein
VWLETGKGNHRRVMCTNEIAAALGHDITCALLGLHAFTGCDTTSAFFRKGKKSPFNIMRKNCEFVETFKCLGSSPNCVESKTLNTLEHFVCVMYGNSKMQNVNKLRCQQFQSRYSGTPEDLISSASSSGMDLSLLPPCRSTLKMHCLRANYQTFIWRKSGTAYPAVP